MPTLLFAVGTVLLLLWDIVYAGRISQLKRAPRTVFIVHFLAFFIPLLLEWLHVVPASYEITHGALILKPWAVSVTPTALLFSMISIVLLQVVGTTFALDAQRREQDLAQETVHLQSWQFSQLVKR